MLSVIAQWLFGRIEGVIATVVWLIWQWADTQALFAVSCWCLVNPKLWTCPVAPHSLFFQLSDVSLYHIRFLASSPPHTFSLLFSALISNSAISQTLSSLFLSFSFFHPSKSPYVSVLWAHSLLTNQPRAELKRKEPPKSILIVYFVSIFSYCPCQHGA